MLFSIGTFFLGNFPLFLDLIGRCLEKVPKMLSEIVVHGDVSHGRKQIITLNKRKYLIPPIQIIEINAEITITSDHQVLQKH